MVKISEACQPECPGMHTRLFGKEELERAEKIAKTLKGMDIYSAQQLLEKVNKYLLLTIFDPSSP